MIQRMVSSLIFGLLVVLTGCESPTFSSDTLQQTSPRKLKRNVNLPNNARTGFTIAGLKQGAVPQGLSLLSTNVILTSHYFDDGQASKIVSTDWVTGTAMATLQLMEPDGSLHAGHVGGLAATSTNLWIASDAYLYCGSLDVFTNSTSVPYPTRRRYQTEAKYEVAFCSVFGDLIWVGEFAWKDKFPTPASHHVTARDGSDRKGWACGYQPDGNFEQPEKILSIPDQTQGMISTGEYIILSRSYGRINRSTLDIFHNPLNEDPHITVQTSAGDQAPLWFLDGLNHIRSIDLPPMAENIAIRGDELLVLFEAGATKFRWFRKAPIDQLIRLNLNEVTP